MKINWKIYNDIQSWDVGEFIRNAFDTIEEGLSVHANMCALEDFNKQYWDLDEDCRQEVDQDQFIKVCRLSVDSLLYEALQLWYQDKPEAHVRGGYVYKGYLYYGTGIGYDTVSSDLLDCDCDGIAKEVFISFLNEDEDTLKKGGKEYMKATGHSKSIR